MKDPFRFYLRLPSIGLPKFAFPFLTNRFTAVLLLCKEFGKGIKIASPIPFGWRGFIESSSGIRIYGVPRL